ncbi:MAG TPA: SIMPL domain-containing protein, partial [Chitinophagaceae bacterium]|nr:SIMPL domain-containing protein [Chitinophagaceae bacterium]
MKEILSIVAIMCIARAVTAQPNYLNNPFPKTISVSGSAEMEIVPDEIFVNIQLSEYQKRGEPKKDLETIKTQFLQSTEALGIPDSLVSIIFYSGYSNSSYY